MAEIKEVNTYFGRCRCCMSYGYLKDMWSQHIWNGEIEVYGEMLVDCFALTWDHDDDKEHSEQDQICNSCIPLLRIACNFKKKVLESQELIINEFEEEISEDDKLNIKIEEIEQPDEQVAVEFLEEEICEEIVEKQYEEVEFLENVDAEVVYLKEEEVPQEETHIEYLEEDDDSTFFPGTTDGDDDENKLETRRMRKKRILKRKNQREANTDEEESNKPKWPKRLPKHERNKTYKQYTEEDMRNCLEAIRKNELSLNDAAEFFKIPKKTLKSKLQQKPQDIKANRKKETAFQFVQEIKKILTYTNATPFKSKANRVFCMYCPLDSPHFEDPDELRSHTRNQHIYERTNKIEYTMRPLWLNEILKLDIHNLICTVCCLPISGWNEMFKHLKTQHSASFTHAFTKAIPYTLTSENECALCKTQFPNFLLVDTHMNGHYNNYVCADCGDTFICEYRLKQHIKIHEAKHHCSYCNKTFILEKHKRSHEDTVHEKIPKFKCHYCDEKFSGDLSRHMHTLEKHEEKVTPMTCEICGKTFTWKAYYTNHMRKVHGEVSYKNGQAYQCEFCGQEFTTEAVLKKHNLKHVSSEETKYACSICNKLYGTRKSLRVHIKNLHPDHGDSESNSQDSYNFVIKS